MDAHYSNSVEVEVGKNHSMNNVKTIDLYNCKPQLDFALFGLYLIHRTVFTVNFTVADKTKTFL